MKSSRSYHEQGDKSCKLLAHQLQQTASSHQIPQIQTSSDITIDLKRINDEFKEYYTTLYMPESTADTQEFDNFFANLEFPLVHLDMVTAIEKPITRAELSAAFTSLQGGKCPRPDGFPVEIYRQFQHKLLPILLDMFNELFQSGTLPTTLNQASISLILKKNKDLVFLIGRLAY